MHGKILGLTGLALLMMGSSYHLDAASLRESPPPFEVSSMQKLDGEGTWPIPGPSGLKVKVHRRSGNGPKGWLVDLVGRDEVSRDFFYLLDGPSKFSRSGLYLARLDGRPALVSWQPDLDVIETFPSPQRVPRQVNFWMLGDNAVRHSGPYPQSTLEQQPVSGGQR